MPPFTSALPAGPPRRLTGAQLRLWITYRGVSDRYAAEMLGVSRNTLRRWLEDETEAPPWLGLALAALAKGLEPWQPS